ncbi:alanine racemase [Heyndrickxia sp. NPDC080065]|uniref:alanine racemase n=1 Tax=Heyndrickxia sp. NPDC080065 TaxID=3390568 RepID=UPI003D07E160
MSKVTPFFRDTWVEINLDQLTENVTLIKNHLPSEMKIFAVVKANAYGHGDVQIGKTALQAGAFGLAVAFLDEAISLRNSGIQSPILVLGASRACDAPVAAKHGIALTVFQREWLEEAVSFLNKDKLLVHVKCDTGMGRIGVREIKDLKEVETFIRHSECIQFEGLFTHFATADELDDHYYKLQLHRFKEMVEALDEKPPLIHCANSATALRFDQSEFNAVRYGIAMYGLSPSEEIKKILPFPLHEVFSLHTKIVHVKKVQAGEGVSYGSVYKTEKEEWIATLPIGYADGWLRKLQGQEVLVEGRRVPIVGRICMDQCMVRLSHPVAVGTTVTLIGKQGNESITIDEIAKKLETINYEIPCITSTRIPRVYIQDGKIVEVVNRLL